MKFYVWLNTTSGKWDGVFFVIQIKQPFNNDIVLPACPASLYLLWVQTCTQHALVALALSRTLYQVWRSGILKCHLCFMTVTIW